MVAGSVRDENVDVPVTVEITRMDEPGIRRERERKVRGPRVVDDVNTLGIEDHEFRGFLVVDVHERQVEAGAGELQTFERDR